MRSLQVALLAILLAGAATADASRAQEWRPVSEPVRWPQAVRHLESASGHRAFVISGIYPPNMDWSKPPHDINWAMRRIKVFAKTDSLFVDPDHGEAWFFTDDTSEQFRGRFRKIAVMSGCIPMLDELRARDWKSPDFAEDGLVQVGRFELDDVSELLHVSAGCGADSLTFAFLEPKQVPFGMSAVREITVHGDAAGSIRATTCPGDSISYPVLISFSSFRSPDFAVARLVGGTRGVATLTETREHCKGHMENALRIYDGSGRYIWLTETGLSGATGVWARDLDRDGVDELIVLAEDHGRKRILILAMAR